MYIKSVTYQILLMTGILIVSSGCFGRSKYTIKESAEDPDARLKTFHSIIPPDTVPQPLLSEKTEQSMPGRKEGPSWWNGKLYFSDQGTGLYVIEPDGSCRHVALSNSVGTTPLYNGNLAICGFRRPGNDQSFASFIVEVAPDGETAGILAEKFEGAALGIPNDCITDRKGGLYFTDPWGGRERIGNTLPGTAVYYCNPKGDIIRLCDWNEFGFPNGCVLSPDDSKFFLNDSHSSTVWIYDVGGDGSISNKQPFAELILHTKRTGNTPERSEADGMAIDRSGNLFVVAEIGVHVFDSTGRLLGIIDIPKQPSHCVFGGHDLSILYITAVDQVYAVQTNTNGFQYPIQ